MLCTLLSRQHFPCGLKDLCQANILNFYSNLAKVPQGNLSFLHLSFLFHLLFLHQFDISSSEWALILCQQL